MMLIIKNWDVKYNGKMKTKINMMVSKGSGGESMDGTLSSPRASC
jgi:hypothetical protein